MTSSLVGSEMCIRDSGYGYRVGSHLPILQLRLWRERSVCSGLVSPGPVSYTHLTLPTICSV
eukprot:1431268-Prorocentrum_lima.AAC.1